MYQIFILLLVLLLGIILLLRTNKENFFIEKEVGPSAITTEDKKLPVKPNFTANIALPQYTSDFYNNPQRRKELQGKRPDVAENEASTVQPREMFFDIFDVTCTQPFKRPWACLLFKGNTINNIPVSNCRKVCPNRFKVVNGEEVPIVESFKNFTEKNPVPQYYYCYNSCKKKCLKYPYNVMDPSKNSCGQNGFSQVPLPVFLSEDECMGYVRPCDNLSKKECLNNPNCGWCTNSFGAGTCFSGTPAGTLNVNLPCQPDKKGGKNAYFQGHLNPFEGITQPYFSNN